MRRTGAKNIKDLISQAISENRLNDGLDKVRVKKMWEDVTGKHIANATSDIYVSSSKLFVSIEKCS